MNAEYREDVQIDIFVLDDGELPPGIAAQFPVAAIEESVVSPQRQGIEYVPAWYPAHMQPVSDAAGETTVMAIAIVVGVAIAVMAGLVLLDSVLGGPAPASGNCLLIVDSSADIYRTSTNNQKVGQLQSDRIYEVTYYASQRYQIDEYAWVNRTEVKTEQISCALGGY